MSKDVINTRLVLVLPNTHENPVKQRKREKTGRIISLVFIYAFLVFAAMLTIFPFYYMIAASFMSEADVLKGRMFPEFATLIDNLANNYSETFNRLNYMRYVGNTLLVSGTITIFQLLTTILASFAFAKLQFKGKDILFIFFLATMMVPGELLAISNYITLSKMNLAGLNQEGLQAFLAMVLPLIASPFYIYLLRQNFMQIPKELYLAAKMDGKSDWQFLWKVMVPLASPTIITIIILSLIGGWNNYVWPNLVVYDSRYTLISVIIRGPALTYQGPDGLFVTKYSWQMTASVMTVAPLLVLFVIFRKYIMRGTGRAGIKG